MPANIAMVCSSVTHLRIAKAYNALRSKFGTDTRVPLAKIALDRDFDSLPGIEIWRSELALQFAAKPTSESSLNGVGG